MKKIIPFTCLLLLGYFSRAQRFFYIENSPVTEKLMCEQLKNASQYVAGSPMGSDYILRSEVAFESGSHALTLSVFLQDSITLQTIFQANEKYAVRSTADDRLFLTMAIQTFIEKNMGQIIQSAKVDHFNGEIRVLKPRKDKT